MQILRSSITCLAGEGRLTLQVPMYAIGHNLQTEEVPDEWFCFLRCAGRGKMAPAVGKQGGFLYLTRAGYEANKEALKTAFEAAIARGCDRTNGRGWVAFEEYVAQHFLDVEKGRQKLVNDLQKKVNEANSFVV